MAAARGIPAAASHPESSVPNGATQATTETPELREDGNNTSLEKSAQCTKSIDNKSVDGKSCDGKSASGGEGGGDDGPGNGSTPADASKPW